MTASSTDTLMGCTTREEVIKAVGEIVGRHTGKTIQAVTLDDSILTVVGIKRIEEPAVSSDFDIVDTRFQNRTVPETLLRVNVENFHEIVGTTIHNGLTAVDLFIIKGVLKA